MVVWLVLVLGGGFCYFLFLVRKSKSSVEVGVGRNPLGCILEGVTFLRAWAILLWEL